MKALRLGEERRRAATAEGVNEGAIWPLSSGKILPNEGEDQRAQPSLATKISRERTKKRWTFHVSSVAPGYRPVTTRKTAAAISRAVFLNSS